MPEAEATYIITNGGINDPDGAKAWSSLLAELHLHPTDSLGHAVCLPPLIRSLVCLPLHMSSDHTFILWFLSRPSLAQSCMISRKLRIATGGSNLIYMFLLDINPRLTLPPSAILQRDVFDLCASKSFAESKQYLTLSHFFSSNNSNKYWTREGDSICHLKACLCWTQGDVRRLLGSEQL